MNLTVIEVKDVSKSYKIKGDIFWALKDISFSVKKGEALGIIGANGAGKTTILRLLAGVTSQSKGKIEINGAIAPLIQIGAGFHPELTGRENVYLNGIIMGLSKKMVDKKFDDIVRFAELERFIDTPVKKYSSGMYVRLGFSVAIHVDADILLIDEILSVGDLSFQRKCLDTMAKIRKSEKSIIFVSHNLSAVRGLCDRAIWLHEGTIKEEGDVCKVVDGYTNYMASKSTFTHDLSFVANKTRWGTGEARFDKVEILNDIGQPTQEFRIGDRLTVNIELVTNKRIASPVFWIGIINNDEVWISGSVYNKKRAGSSYFLDGKHAIECKFDSLNIQPGEYHLVVGVYDEYEVIAYDRIGRVGTFRVVGNPDGRFEDYLGYEWHGVVPLAVRWEFK